MHPDEEQRHDGRRAMRIASTALSAVAAFIPATAHAAAKPPSAVCTNP